MLSMCMRWFYRRAYKRRREALHAAFHNNGNNLYRRLISGLELLTQPLEFNSTEYVELPLIGKIKRTTPTFSLLMERLDFLIKDYALMQSGCEPREFPAHLRKERHPDLPRWLDLYFDTVDAETVRRRLSDVYILLHTYEGAFTDLSSPENNVLWNRSQHILRELEQIVEHYL